MVANRSSDSNEHWLRMTLKLFRGSSDNYTLQKFSIHYKSYTLQKFMFRSHIYLKSVPFELLYTTLVLYAGGWPFSSCKSPMQTSMVGVSNSLRSYPSRLILFCCYCTAFGHVPAHTWSLLFNIVCHYNSAMTRHIHGHFNLPSSVTQINNDKR